MLTIHNAFTNAQSDYSRAQLEREAKHAAKHAPDGDGKMRAWRIEVYEGRQRPTVNLAVDYLTLAGEPRTLHVAI